MGCLCSKSSRQNPDIVASNELIQRSNETQGKSDQSLSLLFPPPQSTMALRDWMHKQGHLVKNIKKRYFILTPSSVKYYKRELPTEPFGEGLCGEVSLKGAVLEIFLANPNGVASVHIIGRQGQKDIRIDLNKDNYNKWISAIEWSIWKSSKKYVKILRNPFAPGYTTEGEDWLSNEVRKFKQALENLRACSRVAWLQRYRPDGSVAVQKIYVDHWIREGATIQSEIGEIELRADEIGIRYKLDSSGYNSNIPYTLGYDGEAHFVNADDKVLKISNIMNISILECPKLCKCQELSSCSDGYCEKRRHQIVSIESCYWHTLKFEVCCVHDYLDLFQSLRDIWLYFKLGASSDSRLDIKEMKSFTQSITCAKAKMLIETSKSIMAKM